MAAGTAGPPVDELLKTPISADPSWQSDFTFLRGNRSEPHRYEAGPSRPVSITSKASLCTALSSPSAAQAFVQTLASAAPHLILDHDEPQRPQASGVFFVRSDADSLKDAIVSTSHPASERMPPQFPSSPQEHALSAGPDHVLRSSAPSRAPSGSLDQGSTSAAAITMSPQPITSSPSPLSGSSEPTPPRPARPGRPTLTRLNTSEMLRTQTSTTLELGQTPPVINRKSPRAMKLQLDTSVPRRSATLSSYPHLKSRPKAHPQGEQPPPHFAPSTSVCGLHKEEGHGPAFSEAQDPTTDPVARPIERKFTEQSADRNRDMRFTSVEEFEFEVSTILPNFLYLGPDIQNEQDITELHAMGVCRVLNVAREIDELGPLNTRDRFQGYLKLPMLDSVEAKGVQDSIREACTFLDDARLRSEPVYVHCKAGKSRSVTIVIAYLIHALRWTLQRSYLYVVEKRAAICPNIGFVAELMRYEEKELKLTRSTGIYGDPTTSAELPVSKSSTSLLPAWGESKGSEPVKNSETAPSLATPAHDAHQTLAPQKPAGGESGPAFGSTISKSSPILTSLATADKRHLPASASSLSPNQEVLTGSSNSARSPSAPPLF